MSIKYRTNSWGNDIEKVEVTKETEFFVTYIQKTRHAEYERREKKDTRHSRFFDTFEQAKNYLIERYEASAEAHENQAQHDRASADRVRMMEEK